MTTTANEPVDNAQPSDDTSSEQSVPDENLPEDLQPTDDNPLARNPGQQGSDVAPGGGDSEGGPDPAAAAPGA